MSAKSEIADQAAALFDMVPRYRLSRRDLLRYSAFTAGTLSLGALVTACGTGTSTSSGNKQFRVGFAQYSKELPLFVQIDDGIAAKATEYGWQLDTRFAEYDASTQSSQIEQFISEKRDFIMVNPVDGVALVPAYREAKQAGIPVLSVGNRLAGGHEDLEFGFIGQRWDDVAVEAANWVMGQINKQGDFIVIHGPAGISFVELKKAGLHYVVKQNPGTKIVFEQNATGFTNDEGLRLASAALTAHRDAKVIWTDNDDLALGAVQAVKERGVSPKPIIVGGDGYNEAIQQVCNGTGIDYDLALRGYTEGVIAMGVVHDYLVDKRKPASYLIPTKTTTVRPDNCKTITPADLK